MAAAARVDPKLLGYGDTFGSYGGRNLGDTDIFSTAIDSSKLRDINEAFADDFLNYLTRSSRG